MAQTSLFLIVKKNRADHAWQFPQGAWEEGESIRAVRGVEGWLCWSCC